MQLCGKSVQLHEWIAVSKIENSLSFKSFRAVTNELLHACHRFRAILPNVMGVAQDPCEAVRGSIGVNAYN
jgi:hypothetical protein